MKFKHCLILVMILIILLFSLGNVAANENVTVEASSTDDVPVSLGSNDDAQERLSSSGSVDLSVKMDVTPSYVDGKYNPTGSEVPWTITVSANGGNAKNVKVREVLSTNLGYASHKESIGIYDPESGIWDVGDLKNHDEAKLTLWTKLKKDGTFLNKVYVTSDSFDKNMLNNFMFLSIKSGSSKVTSNITETTDDRSRPYHNIHQSSMASRFGDPERTDPSPDPKPDPDPDPNPDPDPDSNGGSLNKRAQSYMDMFSSIPSSLMGANSSSKGNLLASHVRAISPYDYTKIPISIFVLFLIMLFAVISYGKIKSRM